MTPIQKSSYRKKLEISTPSTKSMINEFSFNQSFKTPKARDS